MNKQLEEAIKTCKKIIQSNNEIVKQTRKNRDINAMQLTANCDNESIAIETVLKELERLQEENRVRYEILGRKNGRTAKSAMDFYTRVKSLETNKMFGVINFKNGILLSKDEVVNKKAIEKLIHVEKINISGLEVIAIEDLKELLEGE